MRALLLRECGAPSALSAFEDGTIVGTKVINLGLTFYEPTTKHHFTRPIRGQGQGWGHFFFSPHLQPRYTVFSPSLFFGAFQSAAGCLGFFLPTEHRPA